MIIKVEKILLPLIIFILIFNVFFTAYYFTEYKKPEIEEVNKDPETPNQVLSRKADKKKNQKIVKLIFTGDLMMDRYIRLVGESKGYDFILKDVKDLLGEADHVITNLEGPVTEFESVSVNSEPGSKENYIFTMSYGILDELYDANIRYFNLGNNHIYNFGVEGYDQTIKYLNSHGMEYFGDLSNINEVNINPLVIDKGDFIINIFNYNQFGGKEPEDLAKDIKYHDSFLNINLVYAHWGDEYETVASQKMRDIAEIFIDNGADLILGSHPHVIQDIDEYKGKKIYYSLGNFVMDQYFDESVRKGLILIADVSMNGIEITTEYVYLNADGSTTLFNNKDNILTNTK